jgi:hypothetical protein
MGKMKLTSSCRSRRYHDQIQVNNVAEALMAASSNAMIRGRTARQ